MKQTLRQIFASLAVLTAASAAQAQPAAQPVVLELFTSQGCSSCPPANAALARVADRPDVVALTFAVTYWDHLGWKDTFARPEFTERQAIYAQALAQGASYTPEIVAGGRTGGVGNSDARLAALIAKGRASSATTVVATDQKISVAAGVAPSRGADVWLVRYDPRVVQVPIRAGENGGKTLPQRNIVRSLKNLGSWTGQPVTFAVPRADPTLRDVVLVQSRDGGPILAVGRL